MKHSHLFAFVLAVAAFAGCAKERIIEPVSNPDLIPINVNSSINQVQTKATAEGFVDKDAVGLYAVNYSENNTVAGTLVAEGNQADNVKYVFDETNHKWNPVKSVYYKDVNTNVDIYLYYPFQETISDVNAAGFEVKKDQSAVATATALSGYEASDFLWGKGTNITPVESAVSISLAHKLSAIQVTLAEKGGFEDGEFESLEKGVIVMNTTRKATINYATGEASPLGGPQLDGIVMCPQNDGSFRAIVIPQSVSAGTRLFSITIGGVTYGFKQDVATEYLAGKQLNITINITKKTPSGEYELSLGTTQIVDWTEDKNTHGGEARQYYVVNVEEPGTLGKIIKEAKKNPNKIRNLKVIGIVSNRDYYFMRDSMAILESINLKEVVTEAGIDPQIILNKSSNKYEEYVAQYGLPDLEEYYTYTWFKKEIGIIPANAFKNKKALCYFTFPEHVTIIGEYAFHETSLSGAMILPDEVVTIGNYAFARTKLTSLSLSPCLKSIGSAAFYQIGTLSGNLLLPESLLSIGVSCFSGNNFSGNLTFPKTISYIGLSAFESAGSFTGNLIIPSSISKICGGTFRGSHFSGQLIFEGNTDLVSEDPISHSSTYGNFAKCGFSGELIIPNGVVNIPIDCFRGCSFSKIILAETTRTIETSAFQDNICLEKIDINDGLISIGNNAFSGCNQLIKVEFPISLQSINSSAFADCFYLSSITCNAIEPTAIYSNTFSGVSKDNFTVEVPAQSVKRYQSETGWQDFKRIAAHYDFSLSRERMRVLNAAKEKTYTLRAPAGFDWSVTEKPEWVTVSPSSGTGKTDVTISISDMARTSDTFEVNEGTYNSPKYVKYKGRAGEIIFTLTEKEYSCSMDVEQYDYDYADGYVKTYQTAATGSGIDIVFIGDGYDAKDIAKGTFLANAEAGYGHLFDVEPYKTYKDYFNVKAVIAMSDESGIGTVNTIVDTKFGSYLSQNRILCPAPEPCFAWAKKANPSMDLTKSLTIMMMNTSTYEGVTMMYGDGSAIALCPVSTEAYPYDYRGLVQHEAGGHGFGKLGDEYIYHNAFIQNCACTCCEHPQSDNDTNTSYGKFKSLGWYKNLSMNGNAKQVPWAHLIYNPKYSDYVDMYEGGYMHTRGMYRSEATSCMNNNIPYYSAISRQAIVERIKYCAGETFDLEDFYAKDKDTFGTITKGQFMPLDRTGGVDPIWNRGSEDGSVIYMGEHPDYNKIK